MGPASAVAVIVNRYYATRFAKPAITDITDDPGELRLDGIKFEVPPYALRV